MASYEYIPISAACPCGKGSLKRMVASPNYPHGIPSLGSIEFNCNQCSLHWSVGYREDRLFHSKRQSCPARVPLSAANNLRYSLLQKIEDLKKIALREELQAAGAKTKAAECRYLVRRKLFDGSYRTYLRGGQWQAVSRMDPSSIPECASLLEELKSTDETIRALRAESDRWLEEHRQECEFQLVWHF